jgi:predicted SAM-dependent methyltransferase
MIKLNIGCGWRNFGNDWVHIDGGDYEHLDHHDVSKLPYADNSVDLIYSSHMIEYFDRQEIIDIIKEWHRVLKPNGILRIAVPDFYTMCLLYENGNINLNQILGPLYGKMQMGEETIYHKTVYDFPDLSSTLESCGFSDVSMYDWKDTEHSQFDDHSQAYFPHMDKDNGTLISLNVEATK